MKNLFIVTCAVFLLSACEEKHELADDKNRISEDRTTPRRIEAGGNFNFICEDDFNNTKIKLSAVWDPTNENWKISLDERDVSNNQVLHLTDLIGTPDELSDWGLIHIQQNGRRYGRLSQNGGRTASYDDGRQISECIF